MKNKSTTAQLKNAIQLLKEEQAFNWQLLIKQFHHTYESLKPVNLLKSTLKEVASSSNLKDDILGASIGIATGYLSKKIIVGGSDNKFRKLLGSIMQFGVTNMVTKNPEKIKSFGQFIYKHVFHKKERISALPEE